MNSKLKLLPAALLVSVLTMAGCGGGSDSGSGNDVSEDPSSTQPDHAPDTSLEDAVDSAVGAATASERAMELRAEATEAAKALAAADVDGLSQRAYDNVMTVLRAGTLIEAERMTAADAVKAIEDIDTSGMSEDAMDRIADILKAAKKSLSEIVAIQDADGDGSLAAAVAAVKSGTAVDDSDSKIAQAKADVVSAAIAAAIDPTTATTVTQSAASSGAPKGIIMHAGMSGMTFEEIEGSARMAATKIGDFTAPNDTTVALTALDSAGTAVGGTTPASYKGIQGTLVCLSVACGIDDGDITGTVEFVPTNPNWRYYLPEVGGNYARQLNAATYGHWLTEDSNGVAVINLHHSSLATSLSWVDPDEDTKEATYNGNAMGYSHRTVGEGDDATTSSGEFTAKVSLKATFTDTASEASIGGSISEFDGDGGAHVNPAWRVTLGSSTTRTDSTFTGSVPNGEEHGSHFATDGDWVAHGYGATSKNPTGFVGAFDAAFGTEGEAAGVFKAE